MPLNIPFHWVHWYRSVSSILQLWIGRLEGVSPIDWSCHCGLNKSNCGASGRNIQVESPAVHDWACVRGKLGVVKHWYRASAAGTACLKIYFDVQYKTPRVVHHFFSLSETTMFTLNLWRERSSLNPCWRPSLDRLPLRIIIFCSGIAIRRLFAAVILLQSFSVVTFPMMKGAVSSQTLPTTVNLIGVAVETVASACTAFAWAAKASLMSNVITPYLMSEYELREFEAIGSREDGLPCSSNASILNPI